MDMYISIYCCLIVPKPETFEQKQPSICPKIWQKMEPNERNDINDVSNLNLMKWYLVWSKYTTISQTYPFCSQFDNNEL